MLKDADPAYFAGIYIVCGYTDLRYGIDSLVAIIERKYHMNLFIPNTLFLFCGRSASKFQLNFCFSLCKTENFFSGIKPVLHMLCTASRGLLTVFIRSPKLCTALSFFIFIFRLLP